MTDRQSEPSYENVCSRIEQAAEQVERNASEIELVAVSKTYFADKIEPVIAAGHRIFGENRVQESQQKWPELKQKYPDIELRLIGPLQSNKTADAVELFDVIESVDREKIARALAKEMEKQQRHLPCFIQVNTGLEEQKAGIAPAQLDEFVALCREQIGLEIVGLMCIPPFDENPGPHFALLRKLARRNGLAKLSMGMSSDFETAIEFGATSVRVGSAIFGARK